MNINVQSSENVPSYQNELMRVFKKLFRIFQLSSIANIGDLPYGVLGTTPKFGLREGNELVPVFTSSKQRRKLRGRTGRKRKSALQVQNLLFTY